MSTEYLNNLCKGCFEALAPANPYCPACGYDQNAASDSLYRLHPRTVLNGKYLVGNVLGEGGFGITYVGHDLNLHTKVAIKEYFPSGFVARSTTISTTVQPATGQQGEYFHKGKDRFVEEARRLARFRNLPGIVMVIDYFMENGTAYIVMEFVEGQTFKTYLTQTGERLPAAQVLEMLKPVFNSLGQIHESGIIHRDISPDNLMIDRNGNVKLLDFGAAREFGDEENKSISVMLKHGYAPVEQYSTKGIQGAHTDVYALSATIYRAITGVTPESSMDRVLNDTLQPPSSFGIYLPDGQEAALMKGLAIRQENRFQTVSELNTALSGTKQGQGEWVEPLPPLQMPAQQAAMPVYQEAAPPTAQVAQEEGQLLPRERGNGTSPLVPPGTPVTRLVKFLISVVGVAVLTIVTLLILDYSGVIGSSGGALTSDPGGNGQIVLPPPTIDQGDQNGSPPTLRPPENNSVFFSDFREFEDNKVLCSINKLWYENGELHVTLFINNGYSDKTITAIRNFNLKLSTSSDVERNYFAQATNLRQRNLSIAPKQLITWTFVISGDNLLSAHIDLDTYMYFSYSFAYDYEN